MTGRVVESIHIRLLAGDIVNLDFSKPLPKAGDHPDRVVRRYELRHTSGDSSRNGASSSSDFQDGARSLNGLGGELEHARPRTAENVERQIVAPHVALPICAGTLVERS
jgi:hypothetical protein